MIKKLVCLLLIAMHNDTPLLIWVGNETEARVCNRVYKKLKPHGWTKFEVGSLVSQACRAYTGTIGI